MGQKLWGITSGAEAKPNWLTDEEKDRTVATSAGWVLRHASGIEEVLVAVPRLATRIAAATIAGIRWKTKTGVAVNAASSVTVDYNEKVTVTGNPTLVLTGGAPIGSILLSNPGSGYTTASATVSGDGFGATVAVTLSGGSIDTITLTNAGTGYRTATIVITGDGQDAAISVTLGTPLSITATYASTNGAGNALTFNFTAPAAQNWLDVNAQSLVGGTIVETGVTPTVNAERAISADISPDLLRIKL